MAILQANPFLCTPANAGEVDEPLGTFKCTACGNEQFPTSVDLRVHAKSERHVYNTKRKLAGLKPISEEKWMEKICEVRAGGPKKGTAHLKGPVKKDMRDQMQDAKDRGDSAATPSMAPATLAETITEEEKAAVEAAEKAAIPLRCLFDKQKFESIEANLAYMERTYSFFLPDREYCIDLPGMLQYSAEKINKHYVCLYCNRTFADAWSVRKHMIDKSHTRIGSEIYTRKGNYDELATGLLQDEHEGFYDFSSSVKEITSRIRNPDKQCEVIVRYFDKDEDGVLKFKETGALWEAATNGQELNQAMYQGICGLVEAQPKEGLDADDLLNLYEKGAQARSESADRAAEKVAARRVAQEKAQISAVLGYYDADGDGCLNEAELATLLGDSASAASARFLDASRPGAFGDTVRRKAIAEKGYNAEALAALFAAGAAARAKAETAARSRAREEKQARAKAKREAEFAKEAGLEFTPPVRAQEAAAAADPDSALCAADLSWQVSALEARGDERAKALLATTELPEEPEEESGGGDGSGGLLAMADLDAHWAVLEDKLVDMKKMAKEAKDKAAKDKADKAKDKADDDEEADDDDDEDIEIREYEDEDEFAEVMKTLGLAEVGLNDVGDLTLPNGKVATNRDVSHIYKQRGVRPDVETLALRNEGRKAKGGMAGRALLMLSERGDGCARMALTKRQNNREGKRIVACLMREQKHHMEIGIRQNLLQKQRGQGCTTGVGDMSYGR